MKISLLQEELMQKILVASRFVSVRPQLPILANLLLKAKNNILKVSATNLESGVVIIVSAKIEEEGEITLPAKIFLELISNLPPEKIEIKEDRGKISIKTPTFSGTLSGIPAAEFPPVPDSISKTDLSLEKETLLALSKKVAFAASEDETRPVLTGVLLSFGEKTKAVATDGFRMSYKEMSVDKRAGGKNKDIIIPANIITEIEKMVEEGSDVKISTEKEGQITFATQNIVLTGKTITGNFPDYQKVLPGQWKSRVTLGKEDLERAVKTAAVFARESASVVRLKIRDGEVLVKSESKEYGKEEFKIEAKKEGDDTEIAYNYRYVLEFLGSVEGETVTLETEGPLSPGVFQDTKDPSYKHIIMPVRIQN